MDTNEGNIKLLLNTNRTLRMNIVELKKLIKGYEKQIKTNQNLMYNSCNHEWKHQPRVSCYDRVSYYCPKCQSEKY